MARNVGATASSSPLLLHMLQRVPCAWLDVADPDATADLIEHGLEDSWH